MERFKVLFTFLVFLFFYSCADKGTLRQAGDKELTIQLANISDKEVNNDISYAARITPAKRLFTAAGKSAKENLMYRMDSCFYLQKGGTKVYAQLTQQVANGLSGTFEYLVTFDTVNFDEHKWSFIYQDKYLNKRKYTLKLTD